MKRPFEDYIALALIADLSDPNVFEFDSGGFSGTWPELMAHVEKRLGFEVSDSAVQGAIRTLAALDLIRVTDDNYSGFFIKIYPDRFPAFSKKASKQSDEAIADGTFINPSAMKGDYPAAYAMTQHPIFDDYAELGDQWARRAIDGLRTKASEGEIAEQLVESVDLPSEFPASDRVVTRKDNSAEFEQVQTELTTLIELVESKDNETGDKLGDQREVLKQEFEVAAEALERGFFRVSSLLGWLSKALKFVIEKFSGSIVGEAAKKLFELLVGLL